MNKTRQWSMLTAVACLAILAAGWFLVVKPQHAHAASLRTQASSVQASNGQLQSQINQWLSPSHLESMARKELGMVPLDAQHRIGVDLP